MPRSASAVAASLAVALSYSLPALATPVVDAAGDFLPSYTGPRNGDLDVLAADVAFTGNAFRFSATLAGPIGTTPGAFYVWGIDRGTGTERFNVAPLPIGAGVRFDIALAVTPTSATTGTAAIGGVATGGTVTISGNSILAIVSSSLFPPVSGQNPDPFTWRWNFWPRIPATPQTNATIPDFAPNEGTLLVSRVPEPSTWALLGAGLLSFLLVARRRRRG